MADIRINEVSSNYTYNIPNSQYAMVALPITAQWGPEFDYQDYTTVADSPSTHSVGEYATAVEQAELPWMRFASNAQGMSDFISTFRGPTSNHKVAGDYSYQTALQLLQAGYDVLVCRVAAGAAAARNAEGTTVDKLVPVYQFRTAGGEIPTTAADTDKLWAGYIKLNAKYFGTFGNNLRVQLYIKPGSLTEYSFIVYLATDLGALQAVENFSVVLDVNDATETVPYIGDIKSKFVKIGTVVKLAAANVTRAQVMAATGDDTAAYATAAAAKEYLIDKPNFKFPLAGGTDYNSYNADTLSKYLQIRYTDALYQSSIAGTVSSGTVTWTSDTYPDVVVHALASTASSNVSLTNALYTNELLYSLGFWAMGALQDKLAYNYNFVISPWDDQDFGNILTLTGYGLGEGEAPVWLISPMHAKIMDVAYTSRCGAGLIDIPRSLPRVKVYNESYTDSTGYVQKLARLAETGNVPVGGGDLLYPTHSAVFGPWAEYQLISMTRAAFVSPALLYLLIERSMIKQQSTQFYWLLPTNRVNAVNIGDIQYKVTKHTLDIWQGTEGVGVNVLTDIPGLGTNFWGNSTLFEVPPATYQALSNLSTRLLVNAVEDIVYKCGISITFQYNNNQAYNKFYAGVIPTLDTMKNAGAIDDYYMVMSADIDALDSVNANTVVGTIWLTINGVINDINIDLIALPSSVNLDEFRGQ